MNIMPKKISDLLKHWREKRLKNATDEEKIKAADKLKNPIQILKDLSDEKNWKFCINTMVRFSID